MATSSSSSRPAYHQDYIARIRYSNALPPPPNPPKLLDIPGTGLASGQYTSAAFASRLAREQPLNIEADGELGMPINLIGLPGVFEGDESVIYGLDKPPMPHPHDKALLRPLSTLGKPTSVTAGVSFLRRTEYISSDQGRSRIDASTPRDMARMKQQQRKRKREDVERDDDPVRMVRDIYKGFDTAYPEDAYSGPDSESHVRGAAVTAEDRTAWDEPRHPSNPGLTPVDFYPLLPDEEGMPDSGQYFVIKYTTNPLAASDKYDSRLDVAVLQPLELTPEAIAHHDALQKAHEADPTQPAPGPHSFDYEFFVPEEEGDTGGVKDMFDVNNTSKHDPSFYSMENPENGRRFFRYKRIRTYETNKQTSSEDQYGDTIALALHDPSDLDAEKHSRLQKAAYFYPITQRTTIRPRRRADIGGGGGASFQKREDGPKIDFMDLAICDLEEFEAMQAEAEAAAEGAANGATDGEADDAADAAPEEKPDDGASPVPVEA